MGDIPEATIWKARDAIKIAMQMEYGADFADAVIERMARAALSAALSLSEQGWKLVPVEPTEAMELAGTKALDEYWGIQGEMVTPEPGVAYRAMLAAAPLPVGDK